MILRALAMAAVLTALARGAAVEDLEGRPVAEIAFLPEDQPMRLATLLQIVELAPGEPLDIRRVTGAVERLFRTGRFEDILVEGEETASGVRLVFRTMPAWFIGRVTVEGVPDPPNPGQLANATEMALGQRYNPQQVAGAINNIRDLLKSNGFYNPKISAEFTADPEFAQVHIRFVVEPGARAKFGRPSFSGDAQRSPGALLRTTGWKSAFGFGPWREATASRVQRGIDRLGNYYRNRDYLAARVFLAGLRYEPEANRVVPSVQIEKGSRVRVRTEGARVSRGKLRQLVPVFQEQAVDTDLLVEGARNLTHYLQAQGYFNAEVDFQRDKAADGTDRVTFHIDRGDRYKMVAVRFAGNRYFNDETLRERMYMRPARFLQMRWGRFSEDLLEKDCETIEALYRTNGFRQARVEADVNDSSDGRRNRIEVTIRIDEGPQWLVSGLNISGVNLRYYEYITSLLNSAAGQPYSESNVAADRELILNFYYDNGYPEARLDVTVQPGAAPNLVDLRYVVSEGPRRFVRGISIGGLRATREELVSRRIGLAPGDPLSLTALVESQRKLYDLGIFAKVDVAVQNPDGFERNRHLVFQMEEAKRYALDFGFGAELGRIGGGGATRLESPGGAAGFSPRLSVGVSRGNMFGIGHTASINSQFSTIRRRAVLSYLAPQVKGNPDWNLQFSALYDLARDVRTFTSARSEASVQLGQRLSRATSLQYRVSYRLVEVDEQTLKIDPDLIPLFSLPVRVGSLGGSHIIDRRDDPIESRRGVLNTVDFSLAARWLGSKTSFSRLVWKNSTYHRVGRQVTLARSLTLGWLYSIRGLGEDGGVPLPERYFGGGATSHRGFAENQAGPRDLKTGFPVGGNATLVNNLELRFPLLGENVGGVLFHDAGNVYSSLNNLSFRVEQRDKSHFDYMVHAFGFGIRYRTPVGPVRLDLAFSPNTPRFRGFEGSREELLAGQGRITDQRLSRFQFQFSIGQTF